MENMSPARNGLPFRQDAKESAIQISRKVVSCAIKRQSAAGSDQHTSDIVSSRSIGKVQTKIARERTINPIHSDWDL
jgi:hypothetical protein